MPEDTQMSENIDLVAYDELDGELPEMAALRTSIDRKL